MNRSLEQIKFTECLRKAIKDKGIATLTKIQEKAIPIVSSGINALLMAPTGSGKTEAALWPIIEKSANFRGEKGFKVIYVTPLRALNRDLEERIKYWASACELRVGVRHGDTSKGERASQSRNPPDLMITTPETLQIMLTGPKLSSHMKSVRWLIIDEVHELLDDKRGVQLSLLVKRVEELSNHRVQKVLISATLGNPELALRFFLGDEEGAIIRAEEDRPVELEILYPTPEKEDYELSKRTLLEPGVVARLRALERSIRSAKSSIVFTNTRSMAEALGYRISTLRDLKVHVHHSSLSKEARVESETLLREGKLAAVISTSSLELGIDIGHVDLVVQYGSPRQATKLAQRVGRSGHGPGRKARGIIITLDSDDFLESLVLARRVISKEIEPIKPLSKPYDVLFHFIMGLLIRERRVSLSRVLELVRRAWPYKSLEYEELRALLEFMSKSWPRLFWLNEDDTLSINRVYRNTYAYFFEHLSTIPESTSYPVIDDETGFYVGQLDEAFVLEHVHPGVKFVFRGAVWRVKRVEGGRIYVEQSPDPLGAIPSWVGEQLPVPFEVSQEVGRLRRRFEDLYRRGLSLEEIASELRDEYPFFKLEEGVKALETLQSHLNRGYPMPTDERIVVEEVPPDGVVVHSCLGTLINRTVSKYLSKAILDRYKVRVHTFDDQCRIVVVGTTKGVVMEALSALEVVSHSYLVKAVEDSSFFRIRLLNVAKRLGLIRTGTSSRIISLSKLAKAYEGTPVYKEAIRETLVKDFDVEGTISFFRRGVTLQLSEVKGPSPLSMIGLNRSAVLLEILPEDKLSERLLTDFKYRLLRQQIFLTCSKCWSWGSDFTVSSLLELDEVRCPKCGSSRVVALSGKWIRRAKGALEEAKRVGKPIVRDWELANRVYELGRLAERYGKLALVAMSVRGLDPMDVRELMMRHKELSDEFLKDLAKAETEAIKRKLLS